MVARTDGETVVGYRTAGKGNGGKAGVGGLRTSRNKVYVGKMWGPWGSQGAGETRTIQSKQMAPGGSRGSGGLMGKSPHPTSMVRANYCHGPGPRPDTRDPPRTE